MPNICDPTVHTNGAEFGEKLDPFYVTFFVQEAIYVKHVRHASHIIQQNTTENVAILRRLKFEIFLENKEITLKNLVIYPSPFTEMCYQCDKFVSISLISCRQWAECHFSI